MSTRFSPLFNFNFSLAINRLGKQNAGKKNSAQFFFFFFKRRTYSGAFETATIGLKRPIAAFLNCHYSLFCFKKKPYSSGFKSAGVCHLNLLSHLLRNATKCGEKKCLYRAFWTIPALFGAIPTV